MSRLMQCGLMSWLVLGSPIAARADDAEDKAFKFVEGLGGKVTRDEKLPGKPVVGVNLDGTKMTDAGLKELAPLKNLTTLNLGNTQVTGVGLKELAPLKNLTTLNLNSTRVTDAGLIELFAFKNLAILDLGNMREVIDPKVGDKDYRGEGKGVTDTGLKEIAKLTSLTTLTLSYTKVSDAGLKELALLKNLTTLNLSNTPHVTDMGLKELAPLKNLTTLHLYITRVTDTGLKEVAKLTSLTTLTLSYTKVSDAGLKELAPLKNLTTLTTPKVTDQTLAVLREINLLHALTQATNPNGSRPAKPEDVTGLNLSNTPLVTDMGLKELATLKSLTYLGLYGTSVTDAGLKELTPLKTLTTLDLGYTKVTNAGVAELRKALPKCKISR